MRRSNNKIAIIVLLSILTLVLSGYCVVLTGLEINPRMSNTSSELVIGCTFDNLAESGEMIVKGLSGFEKEHGDVELMIRNANMDTVNQLDTIDFFIMKKVDAIIMRVVDQNTINTISQKCSAARIPLITINSPDSVQNGYFAAQSAVQAANSMSAPTVINIPSIVVNSENAAEFATQS